MKELAEASRGKDGDEAALENASALASGVSHFSAAPATAKTTAKPANEVITDSEVITDLKPLPPDEVGAVSSAPLASPQRSPSASACESYREAIELGLSRGRNAVAIYQDLVDEYSFGRRRQGRTNWSRIGYFRWPVLK